MEIPFHPVIRSWFKQTFGGPTEVQVRAWRSIAAGLHTLVAAPTGSGKTLAALLPCLDRIAAEGASSNGSGNRRKGVTVLYVTPLKALNNDIHHHLFRFAAEMDGTAWMLTGQEWRGFTVGVRTGDTSQSTRASMLKNPPDLLITTPESLYLMLTSLKAREILRTVKQVIVDEIHDLAADRRGVHLSLSLERLASLCGRNPQRIGVSATQKPLERVACFLGGWEPQGPDGEEPAPRRVSIVESAMDRRLELTVAMPAKGVRAMDKEAVWGPLVQCLMKALEGCRTALVFVNNRRLCERLTLRLNDWAGYEMAKSHHGSVSRERRLAVEEMLKSGELRCLVATATLELGIDVGHVDLVVQIDSPKQAAAGIQRIGRAGHAVGGASRGVFIIRSRGELPEAAVLARDVTNREIEDIRIPRWSLDVLAQHTVAAVAASSAQDEWAPEELFRLFTQSDCYHGYPYERFAAMLDVLSGLYPFSRPLLDWDRERGLLLRLPASSMAASMGAGTIPQSSAYPVHHASTRLHLGELDEEFVHESRVGDVFQLGTSSWAIQSIARDRVYVTESANALSEIPFWRAEPGGRSQLLGSRIGALLAEIAEACRGERGDRMADRLVRDYYLDGEAAEELVAYVESQLRSGFVPTNTLIVAEHYKDDGARHHLVIHNLLGRRLNRTWEMALRERFHAVCSLPVYSAAKDDGIEFVFPEWKEAWLDELRRLTPRQAEQALWQALPGTSMFGKAFRQIAETSLLLSRGYERQPSWRKRYLSERLLKDALPFADRFPFLREAYTVCLEEYLDVPGLFRLLEALSRGEAMLQTVSSTAPSPFALRFAQDYAMSAMYESDALGRDVHMRLLSVNRSLAAEWFGPDGMRSLITRELLAEEERRLSRPEWLSDGGEGEGRLGREQQLLRLLKEYGDMSAEEISRIWPGGTADGVLPPLERLAALGKAACITLGGEKRWISRDEAEWYERFPHSPEAVDFIARRYAERVLAFKPEELERRYRADRPAVHAWLGRWLEEKVVEPAPFAVPGEEELYTSSKIAGRLVRSSVRHFRQQHEAIPPERYAVYLLNRHHLFRERALSGPEGLLEVIAQLQGIYLPVSQWEAAIFPFRLTDYRKEHLDQLCAAGEVFWLGQKAPEEKEGKIAFFPSASREMAEPHIRRAAEGASSQPELLDQLTKRGASFLSALARETGELPSVILSRLLDLVWEGRVSNDQFAPLRRASLPKGGKGGRNEAFQSGFGRWYAVLPAEETAGEQALLLQYCKHWLKEFGLLTRSAAAVSAPCPWEPLMEVLRQLEEWGMVTRGMFIRGIAAMQFSTKEQVEELEELLQPASGQPVLVSAADPANPYGVWVDWPEASGPGIQFARKPGNFLVYDGGRWILWLENYGKHVSVIDQELDQAGNQERGRGRQASCAKAEDAGDAPDQSRPCPSWKEAFVFALRTLLSRYHLRKIVVQRWNGGKSAEAGKDELFRAIGGEKEQNGYVFWPSSLRNI